MGRGCDMLCTRIYSELDPASRCYLTTLLLSLVGVVFLLEGLYTDPNLPKLSMEEFYVPSLNKTTANTTTGNPIFFDLKLRNMNKAIGLYYQDPLDLTFTYLPVEETQKKLVWEYTVAPFYQGNGKTKHVRSLLENHRLPVVLNRTAVGSQQARELVEMHQVGLSKKKKKAETVFTPVVFFRVDLVTKVKFKLFSEYEGHELMLGADIAVDSITGKKFITEGIELVESGASAVLGSYGARVGLLVISTAFLFMFI